MSLRKSKAVSIVRGHVTYQGEWSEDHGLVHLESVYGAAAARAGHRPPQQIAAALLARLVEATGGVAKEP